MLAFDSYDYPGSPWKHRPAGGTRGGLSIDLSRAEWVPGRALAQDRTLIEQDHRIALYEAMFPDHARLK